MSKIFFALGVCMRGDAVLAERVVFGDVDVAAVEAEAEAEAAPDDDDDEGGLCWRVYVPADASVWRKKCWREFSEAAAEAPEVLSVGAGGASSTTGQNSRSSCQPKPLERRKRVCSMVISDVTGGGVQRRRPDQDQEQDPGRYVALCLPFLGNGGHTGPTLIAPLRQQKKGNRRFAPIGALTSEQAIPLLEGRAGEKTQAGYREKQ